MDNIIKNETDFKNCWPLNGRMLWIFYLVNSDEKLIGMKDGKDKKTDQLDGSFSWHVIASFPPWFLEWNVTLPWAEEENEKNGGMNKGER